VYGTNDRVPDYLVKGGATYRIISDQLGSVRLVVNTSTGETMQKIDYDGFGNVMADDNQGFQPFGYAGGLWDGSTRLERFGGRDYDPALGRWLSKDPLGMPTSGTNLYMYADGDPINYIDPDGHDAGALIYGIGATVLVPNVVPFGPPHFIGASIGFGYASTGQPVLQIQVSPMEGGGVFIGWGDQVSIGKLDLGNDKEGTGKGGKCPRVESPNRIPPGWYRNTDVHTEANYGIGPLAGGGALDGTGRWPSVASFGTGRFGQGAGVMLATGSAITWTYVW
jgi:RHS repeat-associated protein